MRGCPGGWLLFILRGRVRGAVKNASKTLQYLMGHSDIGVTMNTYTHLGLDDAKNE